MAEIRKIAIDEVVESAAAGVLRALDARSAASKGRDVGAPELVKSGFIVDIIIRAGGYPGPINLPSLQQAGQIGQ
jgi:hypothetical protein